MGGEVDVLGGFIENFIAFFLKALHVLKKGSQLLKYGRKGNPKLYSFKLSPVSCWLNPNIL